MQYDIIPHEKQFALALNGKALLTPGKKPFALPNRALAEAVAKEWQGKTKFVASSMPLTTIAYTAIDRIDGMEEAIVEALLVYVDTDTLSYRATGSPQLTRAQNEQWNPILDWAKKTYGATWQVTEGVMPIDQPKDLHEAVSKRLKSLDAMQLSAACMLASGCSSLVLMLAVLDKYASAEEAFRLARLEEEFQAQAWGRDDEAEERAKRMKQEVVEAGHFLTLL